MQTSPNPLFPKNPYLYATGNDYENRAMIKTTDFQGNFQYGNGVLENNYYPFGLTQKGYNNITTSLGSAGAKKYQYNGKELQDDFGLDWYDYGARFYDAGLGRFHTLDPLSERYPFQSPYVYGVNNPIRFIDFMGMGPADYAIWAQKNPLNAIADGFRHMFDAVASLFTVKAGVKIKSTTPIIETKAGKVGGSLSKVTESKAEIVMDGSSIFDYNGQNTKSVSELNPFKLVTSSTTKMEAKVKVTVNVEGVPVNISNTQGTTTGETTNITEMSVGVSSNDTDANVYVNTSTTTNSKGTTTKVAAGAKANVTVTKSGNTNTQVGVYLEAERILDKNKR